MASTEFVPGLGCCHDKTVKFMSGFGIGQWTEAESINESLKGLEKTVNRSPRSRRADFGRVCERGFV